MNKEKIIYELFEEFDFSEEFEKEIEELYADEEYDFETREEAEKYVEKKYKNVNIYSLIPYDCDTTFGTDMELDEKYEYQGKGIYIIRYFIDDLNVFVDFLRKRSKSYMVSRDKKEREFLNLIKFFKKKEKEEEK